MGCMFWDGIWEDSCSLTVEFDNYSLLIIYILVISNFVQSLTVDIIRSAKSNQHFAGARTFNLQGLCEHIFWQY